MYDIWSIFSGSKNWLFSRYSTGWKCGLHPDWTELTGCVDTYLKVGNTI